jgi:hypothetical protein
MEKTSGYRRLQNVLQKSMIILGEICKRPIVHRAKPLQKENRWGINTAADIAGLSAVFMK